MRTAAFILTLSLIVLPVCASSSVDDCSAYRALGALYEVRTLMLSPDSSTYDVEKLIDRRIDEYRVPTGVDSYRWVRWTIPHDNGPELKKGHLAVAVHEKDDRDNFEVSEQHVFAVRIEVPEKRSLFSKNNRVYVGSVHITYEIDGRSKTRDERIEQWMNPDTSRTIDLGGLVADRVSASLDAGSDPDHVRESLVEFHLLQAVLEDDPANPDYPAIQVLRHIRRDSDPATVDREIAEMEHTLFPSSEPYPVLSILTDFRRADQLMRSKKDSDIEKGTRLLKETLSRLR